MDSEVYQKYVNIPKENRNKEEQAYVEKWENLNTKLAGMQERKTQLENTKQEKLNQAGFARSRPGSTDYQPD